LLLTAILGIILEFEAYFKTFIIIPIFYFLSKMVFDFVSDSSWLNSLAHTLSAIETHHDHHHLTTVFLKPPHFAKAFDHLKASNQYNNDKYAAGNASAPGSGYWVSDGLHGNDQVVTLEGRINWRHKTNGLHVNWAYKPEQHKVQISQDGKHYMDATPWTPVDTSTGPTGEEEILFLPKRRDPDDQRPIMGMKLLMKGKPDWGYFGINNINLL